MKYNELIEAVTKMGQLYRCRDIVAPSSEVLFRFAAITRSTASFSKVQPKVQKMHFGLASRHCLLFIRFILAFLKTTCKQQKSP